jgi:ABC-type dipeptide/oligopeptide/nickel transport system permease component
MTLWLYIARRLAVLVPTLLVVSVLIFSLQQLLPGDPALALAGEEHNAAVVAAIRAKYHLDRPLVVQYGIWIGKVLRGDFGESLRSRIPVAELIASKLPVTLQLVKPPRLSLKLKVTTPQLSLVPGKPVAYGSRSSSIFTTTLVGQVMTGA